ncbi:MAG: hypothetical protein M3O50_03680, partial [Myxococcota bacterium]|nr:hypothetical protein [Myxococcota bacterium]
MHAVLFAELGRRARADARPSFDPTSQTLEGETLDVEPPVLLEASGAAPPQSFAKPEAADDDEPVDGLDSPAFRPAPRLSAPEHRHPP